MSQLGGFEATALHLVYARTAQSPSGLWRLYYFSAHFKPGEAPTARSIRKSFEFLDEARYVDTVFRGDLEQELARDARDLGLVVTA
jgi:hypothetical protein